MPPAGARLTRGEIGALALVLAVAALIRAFFLHYVGHATDIGTFESWTRSLGISGPKAFYSHVAFVDYPPGYMLVLWVVGVIYSLLGSGGEALLILVKLPAVIADLFLAYLIYLIARRYWTPGKALFAAAIIAVNPAIWLVSAYWGQADSVAAVFLVWALYLAITERFEFAWAALAFAVLIKPQPLVVAPLLLIWQIRRQGWTWRLALVPLVGLAVAYFGSLPFAPANDPYHVLAWLYDRYRTSVGVYPFNSVNAFNLYSIAPKMVFWMPDSDRIFGIPRWAWGIGIFLALLLATASRAWRTTGEKIPRALAEQSLALACFIALLGLFMLTTRMHERYMFSALAIAPLLWSMGRSYRWIVVLLSVTYVVNLRYGVHYLYEPSQMWHPEVVHPLSLLNVLALFVVAGMYLIEEMGTQVETWLAGRPEGAEAALQQGVSSGPLAREGLVGWARRDYAIVGGLMLAAAMLIFWNLGTPKERIFDEIYYARAAQEYLQHKPQYEWTHPPLTKLMMAATVKITNLPDPVGARVADAIIGVLTIPLLFGFAKRLLSSTLAAGVAVFLLLTSGYYYVQARIATPEIIVAFFSLATLYCAYRLWIASQSVKRGNQLVFADGTAIEGGAVVFPSGEKLPFKRASDVAGGSRTTWRVNQVETADGNSVVVWNRDGKIAGEIGGRPVREKQQWVLWLILTALSVGCVIASKWNGLFDLLVIWLVAALVSAQRFTAKRRKVAGSRPLRFVWGNPYGWRLPIFIGVTLAVALAIYLIAYIPFFQIGAPNLSLGTGLADLWGLQKQMYWYHHNLRATHPYTSSWWSWPFELRPVSYYYHQFSTQPVQIVAEIIALPNPAVWLAGLITVPLAAWWAWRERHKGIMLLVIAFLLQWLPWIASPRIDFQYNFYPNLAIICLCGAYVLQKVWHAARAHQTEDRALVPRGFVFAYLALCFALFVYFFPVLSGAHVTWDQWHSRMWLPYGAPYGWI